MSKLIERLDHLNIKAFDVIGWEDYVSELTTNYFKLRNVVISAEDFLASDGDYFSWTEDERHCLSRLKGALLALEEDT